MEKLQRTINTEFKDLSTSIGSDIRLLKTAIDTSSVDIKDIKDSIDKSDAAIELLREASYKTASNLLALKESAEKELNNLNERIYEVNNRVNSLSKWSVLINDKLKNEYVQLSTFENKTKSQDKIADYLMWAVIIEAFVILGLIFYLCITKVI